MPMPSTSISLHLQSSPARKTPVGGASSIIDGKFGSALRITLTVAFDSERSRLSSIADIRAIAEEPEQTTDELIERLVFAEILKGDGTAFRLARPPRFVLLSEIYVAITANAMLPKTTFDRLYFDVAERVRQAAANELGGLDLEMALSDVLGISRVAS